MKRLFAIPVFMLLFSATVLGQTNSDRVIQLGENASITISEDASFGEYQDQAVRIQLGNYDDYSPAQHNCSAGTLYIVLDPFAPLDDCYDGHITSQSLLQITPDNLPDLTSEDFKTFSFFSEDKSTIGLVQNSCGTAGGFYWYVFYDLHSGQLFGFEPGYIAKGVCGQTHWIDSAQRPPIVGDTKTMYWSFEDKVSYNTTTTYIEEIWSGDYLSDDHPISQGIMAKEYAAAVAGLDAKTLRDLRSLIPGSTESAVADEPADFPDQLSRLFKFLYYGKKSGHIFETKAIVDSLPSELRYVITE